MRRVEVCGKAAASHGEFLIQPACERISIFESRRLWRNRWFYSAFITTLL